MNQWINYQSHQTQQQQQDVNCRSNSHLHFPHETINQSFSHDDHDLLVPMLKYEAGMEKRWESSRDEQQKETLLHKTCSRKQHSISWGQSEDNTLESIVHSSLSRKRTRSNPDSKDRTLLSWGSTQSHSTTFKTEHFAEDLAQDDGLVMHNKEEEHNRKGKTDGSCSRRQTRAAINHNQSERRRRDRINQKMKDLQKLVPNGSKTDRASLLDDTIQYLKQLQAQVQLMCSIRSSSLPQMTMPLGIQQLQMSPLATRMQLPNTDSMAPSSSYSFPCAAAFPPPFLLPSIISTAKPKSKLSTSAFVPPTDPFCTFLAQSMDMDFYSKMVTLYCQEVNKTPHQESKLTRAQCIEGIEEDKH